MKKTDIERIIKQGSTKQKIRLFFTNVAYFNITGIKSIQFKGYGDDTIIEKPDSLLTEKEEKIILDSIKDPKDIKYYEELREWNKVFVFFKPYIEANANEIYYLAHLLLKYVLMRELHINYQEAINDILELVEDKKLRYKLVKTALNSLKKYNAKKYQEKGFLPFIEIPKGTERDDVLQLVEKINKNSETVKVLIYAFNIFLNKHLPIKPYKDYLKNIEDIIKKNIYACIGLMEVLTDEYNKEQYKIINWDDIKVEVTDEDIEDIKRTGI